MGIEIDGLKRVSRKLQKLGDGDFVEHAVMQALGYAAEETRNRAIDLLDKKVYSKPLPEGFSRTGKLKQNVHVERLKTEKGYRVYVPVEYAVYVEFGTGTKGDPSVPHTSRPYWTYQLPNGQYVRTNGMKARPFLGPAFREQKSKCIKRIKATLTERLKQLTGEKGGEDG